MDVNQLIENWSQNQTIATIVGGIVVLLAGVLITKYLLKDDSKYSTKDIKEVANLIDELRGKGETPPFTLEDYKRLEDENRRLKGETQTAETKLRLAAIAIAKEAAKIALEGLGKIPEAKEKFDQAMAIFQDPEVANLYGQFLYRTGDLIGAIREFKIVSAFGEKTGNKNLLAIGISNLGNVYKTRGDLNKAEEYQMKALALHEEIGNKVGMADNKWNLSIIKEEQGKLKEALLLKREVEELCHQVGMPDKLKEAREGIKRLEQAIAARKK